MKRFVQPGKEQIEEIIARPAIDQSSLLPRVAEIAEQVRSRGDDALIEYALQFDKATLEQLWVSQREIDAADGMVTARLKDAIRKAKSNIELFHRSQAEVAREIETTPGVTCWRRSIPISPIGLYIPGGSAPLFSTALMLGVPAQIAGCGEIIVCTPPGPDGSVHPAILYTLNLLGINRICKAGGAQAIAAMAYGTETIPRVQKIFGPGNQYVTAAKQFVSQSGTAIDLPAGPSEVAILADETAVPEFVAADLLSQAEHGPDSQVLLVATSHDLLDRVDEEVARQLEALPRRDLAARALAHSRSVFVSSPAQGMDLINRYAPEHLILACENALQISETVVNAGSVFIGNFTPESAGDYASGTNHTLPTNGFAARLSGVSLDSYFKKVTFQTISAEGLELLGPVIEAMAEAEGLEAHRRAVSIRREKRNV